MVFLNSYSTSNFNSGLQLYNFNTPYSTSNINLGNVSVNNSINSQDEQLLLIGNNTVTTEIGAANKDVELKGNIFLSDVQANRVLQVDNNNKIIGSNSFNIISATLSGDLTVNGNTFLNNGLEMKASLTIRHPSNNSDYIQINPQQDKIFTNDNIIWDGQNNPANHYIKFQNYLYVELASPLRLSTLTASKFLKLDANKDIITSDIVISDITNLQTELNNRLLLSGGVITGNVNLSNLTASKPLSLDSNKNIISGDLSQSVITNLVSDLLTINNNINDKVSKSGDVLTGGLFFDNSSFIALRSGTNNTQPYTTILPTQIQINTGNNNFSILNHDNISKNLVIGSPTKAFNKVQMSQPLEVDNINAIGNTLRIGNDDTTDEIQIGVGPNVHVVNILTNALGEQDTLNFGSGNTLINFFGQTIFNHIEDHRIADRQIVLNANALGLGNSGLCGVWIRDNNFDAYNYFVINSDRDGFLFRAGNDPGSSNSHQVNFKTVNIVASQGKYLKASDFTNTTTIECGNIVKNDLPNTVVFNDQGNDITGGSQRIYNTTLSIQGNITSSPHFGGYIQFNPDATFNIYFSGDRKLSLNGQNPSNGANIFEITGFNVINSLVPLDMGSRKITSSYTATNSNDIPNKNYVDTQDALKLSLTGGTLTGYAQVLTLSNALHSFMGFSDSSGRYAYLGRPGDNSTYVSLYVERAGMKLQLYAPDKVEISAGVSVDFGSIVNVGAITSGRNLSNYGVFTVYDPGNSSHSFTIDPANFRVLISNVAYSIKGSGAALFFETFSKVSIGDNGVNQPLQIYGQTSIYNSASVNQYFQFNPNTGIINIGNNPVIFEGQTQGQAFTVRGFDAGINLNNPVTLNNTMNAGANKITSSATPSTGNDLTNKTYVDNQDNLRLSLTGGTLSGGLGITVSGQAINFNSDHSFISFRDSGGRYCYLGKPGAASTTFEINCNEGNRTIRLVSGNGGANEIEMYSQINMFNKHIVGVASPSNSQDAANKSYVDNAISGSVGGIFGTNNTWTGQQTFNNYIVNINQGLYGNSTTSNLDIYGRLNMRNTQITYNRTNNGGLCPLDFGSQTNGLPLISFQNAMNATTIGGYGSYFYGMGVDNRNGGNGWMDILATGSYSQTYFNNVRFCVNQQGVARVLSGGNGAVEFFGSGFTPTLVDGTNQPNALTMGNANDYAWIQSWNSRSLWLNSLGNQILFGGGPTPQCISIRQGGTNGAIYQAFTNTAGSQTYGYIGLDSSSGGGLFGDGANSFLIGTGTTNRVGFYTNNSKTMILKSDNRIYDKDDAPISGRDPYSNTPGQARWRDGVFTGTFDNTRSISNMAYGNDNPITTGVRYTHTVIPDQNWIFSISGTYTGLTAGWYCFKIEWDDEIYATINEVPFQATSYGSKNFPLYIKFGKLDFNMMILNQSGAGSMAYRLDLLTALNY